ncbi:uncharacterized protein TNCV_2260471 [Trichonephila clavipes]|nr:uncharacterized protein TNCV_2260471 [Trichonephila clavipes]
MGRRYRFKTVQGVVQTDHHHVVFGHGKTRYRSSSRLCRVSSDFSRCLPPVASGLLVVTASDSRPEGLGSMPPNTLPVHTEYVLVKLVGSKVLWAESRVQGIGEYLPPLQSHGKIVGVEIGGVAIYRPFGEFRRANSYCHLTAMAGSDVVQSERPIFDDFFQHLWPYIVHNTANVVFQMVKRLWLIRIDK